MFSDLQLDARDLDRSIERHNVLVVDDTRRRDWQQREPAPIRRRSRRHAIERAGRSVEQAARIRDRPHEIPISVVRVLGRVDVHEKRPELLERSDHATVCVVQSLLQQRIVWRGVAAEAVDEPVARPGGAKHGRRVRIGIDRWQLEHHLFPVKSAEVGWDGHHADPHMGHPSLERHRERDDRGERGSSPGREPMERQRGRYGQAQRHERRETRRRAKRMAAGKLHQPVVRGKEPERRPEQPRHRTQREREHDGRSHGIEQQGRPAAPGVNHPGMPAGGDEHDRERQE